eukprot:GILK01001308.1.p1 GENE.GILK01001308.1~~GILK01001308.1.p1  ORF type:complete len:127 (+),score=12.08 GILK01001308.1:49-381(+)
MSDTRQRHPNGESAFNETGAASGITMLADLGIFTAAYWISSEQRIDAAAAQWNKRLPALAWNLRQGPGAEIMGVSIKRVASALLISAAVSPFKWLAIGSMMGAAAHTSRQ